MAKADLSIVGGAAVTPVVRFETEDRDTSTLIATIKAGEPVKRRATDLDAVEILITGEPTYTTTASSFVGIAEKESTETATADGKCDVSVCIPYITRLRGKATTAGNIDLASELRAFLLNAVKFDGVSAITGNTDTTPYTIDENDTDDQNDAGLVIVDGDIVRGTLDVYVKPLSTLFGRSV